MKLSIDHNLLCRRPEHLWSMYIQADTSLFVSGALRIGPIVEVGQGGGQLVLVDFWATHQWQHWVWSCLGDMVPSLHTKSPNQILA